MYTSYQYIAGATVANILSDIGALITGETNIANLSASVSKATHANITFNAGVGSGFSGLTPSAEIDKYAHHNGLQRGKITANDATTITLDNGYTEASAYTCYISTINIWTDDAVAAWTLHDAAAGTNAKCYKRVYPDDGTKYAYAVIDLNTANRLYCKGYETWNETAHTGTNLCYLSDNTNFGQQINTTSGGGIEIFCNNYCLRFFSVIGTTFGSATSAGDCGLFFRTRKSPWDTVANGYPPFIWTNLGLECTTTLQSFSPRTLSAAGADVTGNSASYKGVTPFQVLYSHTVPTIVVPKNAAKELGHMLIPFGFNSVIRGDSGGEVSTNAKVYLTTYNFGSNLDEALIGATRYKIWAQNTTYRFAVRKG